MTESTFPSELQSLIPVINPNRNYWLVRTSAGTNYEIFVEHGFIGIGWNEVPLSDIHDFHEDPENNEIRERIKLKIALQHYPGIEEENSLTPASITRAVSQIMKFSYDIKKGDIVVIPSYNSSELAFGEVEETPVFIASDSQISIDGCPFRKRKKVKWFKTNVDRNRLDAKLYRFIFSHQTINNINDYAEELNNFILDFYRIEDKFNLVLRIRKEGDLNAFAVDQFYSDLITFAKDFAEHNGNRIESESLSVKLNLQSPGTIVFVGAMVIAVGLISIGVLTALSGGDGKFDFDLTKMKFSHTFRTNSFLDKLTEFLDGRQDRLERTKRLTELLEKFEVMQNKNLAGLTESEPGEEDQ